MSNLSLFILLVVVAVAGAAIWLARQNRGAGGRALRAPPQYTITGGLKITNDCDGQSNSIPNQVMVRTALSNAAGTIQVSGDVVVNVQQDPANPNNPIKIGQYAITVRWLGGNPAHWTDPEVLDRQGALSVCVPISCPPGGQCKDRVPAANVAFNNPQTNHDIQVVCACQ